MLASMLDSLKDEKKVQLAVADAKLGNSITKLPGLDISPISDSVTHDIFRAVREHLPSLIPDILPQDFNTMSLGLSHSLSRHKLKFSPDKVDTMIIQAIALLDDLDKELNTYAMRVKEWYGWHFPEMARIINDNVAYARVVLTMGLRTSAASTDLSGVLPEEIEGAVKAAAEVSMGTEITDDDLDNIQALAEQVVGFTEYRQQLSSYLTARMQAIAPNLTLLVGDLVGARLIAHAGSLMNLAKSPASTIQILGAEKALFRALKTKHDTPKYGLIYHASLIGQATGKNKGKIARMLATKATLGLRVDALSPWGQNGEAGAEEPTEEEKAEVGVAGRALVERRLRALEGKPLKSAGVAIGPGGQEKASKWSITEARKYNKDADGIDADAPVNGEPAPEVEQAEAVSSKKRKMVEEVETPKKSKKSKPEIVAEPDSDVSSDEDAAAPTPKSASKKDDKKDDKAEKAAKKAEKAAKKAEKEAKKAKKEARKSVGGAEDEEEQPKKKKSKKSKD
jgi:nucleolar protein 58